MKVLIHTDSPLIYSGLGRCGRELANKLCKKTHFNNLNQEEHDFEVAYAAWHYTCKRHELPYFIYPINKGSENESKQLANILLDNSPDILLSIGDIWNFYYIQQTIREYKERNKNFKWIVWLTVDGEHLHPSWKIVLDYADDINVFSQFAQQEIFKFSGIRANVIYPGVDKNIFKPITHNIKDSSLPFDIEKSFLVININQNTDRKNIPLTLEAFSEFAQDKDDVFLMLITDPEDTCGYDLWDFVKMFNLNKKVAITKEAGPAKGMTDTKLNLIYNLAHVSINTSIGEGLSMPTLEAMATGTPVMATDYASVPELLNQGGGVKIKVAGYLYGFNGIRRALASKDDIVNNLNMLYNDYKTDGKIKNYITEKSKKFTDILTWDRTANLFMQRIKHVINKKEFNFVHERVKVKDINPLVVIPSFGTHCGIAEYTNSLVSAIRNKGQTVTTFGSYAYEQIPEIIERGKFNIVHIQHEHSFFKNKEALFQLLEKLNSMKIKTILTMHTLVPGLASYNEVLLTHLDDLIVHSAAFKTKLEQRFSEQKDIEIPKTCNIEVIHMGCGSEHVINVDTINTTKKNLGISARSPIIGSFGFLRDQKGFQDFLLAVKTLEQEYPNILALLVCPKHEFGSSSYDEMFFNFIERQGLSKNVMIIREYLEEEKLLNVLQCADMFVLNYHDSPAGGGISAAVKTLFRVQKPIIVNNTIAFCDLQDEVLKINNLNKDSMIEPIKQILNNKMLAEKLVSNANRYIQNNNWDAIAQKHIELYSK